MITSNISEIKEARNKIDLVLINTKKINSDDHTSISNSNSNSDVIKIYKLVRKNSIQGNINIYEGKNELEAFTIGNNYDGCLLTRDFKDNEYFTKSNLAEIMYQSIINSFNNKEKEIVKEEKINDNDNLTLLKKDNKQTIIELSFFTGIRTTCFIVNKINNEDCLRNNFFISGRFCFNDDEEDTYLNNTDFLNISFNEKITDVSLGMYHLLALSDNKEVFSLGSGLKGELGLGENKLHSSSFSKISYFYLNNKDINTDYVGNCNDKILIEKIYSNNLQSYCISTKGKVFCWGYNRSCELGVDIENTYILINNGSYDNSIINNIYSKLNISTNDRIVSKSIKLNDNGIIYFPCELKTKYNDNIIFTDIQYGLKYSVYISNIKNKDNDNSKSNKSYHSVFITGDNKKQVFPLEVNEKISIKEKDLKDFVKIFTNEELTKGIKKTLYSEYSDFKSSSSNDNFNIILKTLNIQSIYSGWSNIYILLKVDYELISEYKIEDIGVHQINKTNTCSIILCFGDNKLNQLALINSKENNQVKKNLIVSRKIIKSLFVGSEFSYFIDIEGRLFSFGWNEHYNLGNNGNKSCDSVFEIDFFKNILKSNNPKDYSENSNMDILLGGAYAYFFSNK